MLAEIGRDRTRWEVYRYLILTAYSHLCVKTGKRV